MSEPEKQARLRLEAIAELERQLASDLSDMQASLYEGLLQRLQETYEDPEQLTGILAEFLQAVHLPVVVAFGESLLELVQFNLNYVQAVAPAVDLVALRAPLAGYLRTVYGIGEDGRPVAGGYLNSYLYDTSVAQQLRLYAYRSQLAGVGLTEYREGLKTLVVGQPGGQGIYQKLYREAPDQFSQADRVLQDMTGKQLGWNAYVYNGGLIESSRAFCKVRNGKVFLREEIEKFGTSQDTYGGYTNKAAGEFNGKPSSGYTPFVQLGGYACRHILSGLPNSAAMNLRPELKENSKGELYIKQ